ncbi:hypothetical protein WR25_10259 [Diploscapter pachys]|uniref:Uncharacterized protein n=1 Tax=Diploscapter pachys TaxID=2018661 RepID=A0A2A2LFR9_9BILA|nr:hypothetical protein WR25_10259 [Diploscapter pachys]
MLINRRKRRDSHLKMMKVEIDDSTKKTGNNIDPKRASEMMKTERDANGKRRFKRDQFLTTSQIKSWFGARARTEKRLIEEKQKKEDQNKDKKKQGRGKLEQNEKLRQTK